MAYCLHCPIPFLLPMSRHASPDLVALALWWKTGGRDLVGRVTLAVWKRLVSCSAFLAAVVLGSVCVYFTPFSLFSLGHFLHLFVLNAPDGLPEAAMDDPLQALMAALIRLQLGHPVVYGISSLVMGGTGLLGLVHALRRIAPHGPTPLRWVASIPLFVLLLVPALAQGVLVALSWRVGRWLARGLGWVFALPARWRHTREALLDAHPDVRARMEQVRLEERLRPGQTSAGVRRL
jgi:hypothetical protein